MHKTQKELQQELNEAHTKVQIGSVYVHYKDSTMRYRVKELAIDTDTSDVCVIYEALYGEQITFVRSLEEWLDEVESNGKKIRRFTLEG
jgi:hypothetical protein